MENARDDLFKDVEFYKTFYRHNLFNVYGRTTPSLRAMIIDLWQRNNILPAGVDLEQRAHQVAMMAVRETGELGGVSTVFVGRLSRAGLYDPDDAPYYFYRMFIQPEDRVPELMFAMTDGTYELLRDFCFEGEKPAGLVFIAENPSLVRRGMKRKLDRRGYVSIGQNHVGQGVFLRRF